MEYRHDWIAMLRLRYIISEEKIRSFYTCLLGWSHCFGPDYNKNFLNSKIFHVILIQTRRYFSKTRWQQCLVLSKRTGNSHPVFVYLGTRNRWQVEKGFFFNFCHIFWFFKVPLLLYSISTSLCKIIDQIWKGVGKKWGKAWLNLPLTHFLADSGVSRTRFTRRYPKLGFLVWYPFFHYLVRAALGVLLGALCVNDAALSWCQVFGSNSQTSSCFPKRIS